MDAATAGILCVFGLLLLMMLGIPIVFSLGFVALAVALLTYGSSCLFKVGSTPFYVWFNLNWLPLPLFVLLGSIIAETTMGADIFNAGRKWLSRVPGGLIASGILGEAVMAAALGTSTACILVVGQMADKEFIRHHYNRGFSLGALLAGGVLGPLIPPSATMIIYSVLTQVSLGQLFIAGVIPGVILATMLVITAILISWWRPKLAPPMREGVSWGERFASLKKVWPIIVVILAALGSIYMGIATPTEAAGIACIVTLIIGVVVFKLRLDGLRRSLEGAAVITGIIMFILVGASLFSYVVGSANIGKHLFNLIESASLSPWMVIIAINLLILVLGFIIDPLTITFLSIPVLYPLITALGFDPLWFGVVFVVNTQIALITPPMALDLFTMKTFFNVPTGELIRGVAPFLIVEVIFLAMLIALPALSTWLPSMMVAK
ncbi:C4-dicarboxylate TRAP transporter large permease protein DctM [subsurface metagenome]